MKILLILLGIGSCYCQTSYRDFPEECYIAETLDDESRSFEKFDSPTGRANDLDLKKGWYRVLGKAGNSLEQGFDRPLQGSETPPHFCGTELPGTLMSEHPTVEEDLVEMTVCFREPFCHNKLVSSCECSANRTIYVRNCGKFYIYWLTPTGANQRYCTGKTSLDGPKVIDGESKAIECTEHKIMDSETRKWGQLADVTCDRELRGWYRMSESSGFEMASKCSTSDIPVSRLSQPCGASFRGWMLDSHPTVNEGRVQRRICFSYAAECSCEFYSNIYVRNCGKFFVYRLNGVPTCNARYCGAQNKTLSNENDVGKPRIIEHKDLCKAKYTVMHDPDRLWSYISPTVSKCDSQLYGVYRFGSKYTPWSILEGCKKTDLSIITHRCGSDLLGYMEGIHPTVKDGIVDRIICFQSAKIPCDCRYTVKIQVQNCGKFYVYNFRGVPACNARFCMVANGSSSITIDPGKFPMYEIPSPGYEVKVEKQIQEKDDGDGGLATTTAVLSIILLIVIILLILVILLLVFVAWPIYKERRRRRVKSDDPPPQEPKPSSSNGNLVKEEKGCEKDNIFSQFPSAPPPREPPKAPDSDSVVDMKRGPGSDDDLKMIPEDTEHSDMNDEYDSLLKKEDISKPKPYEKTTKDSVV